MSLRKKIIAIGGPTASGKTSISIKIAKEFNGEIINTDSRQVYKYLDIGTAKEKINRRNPDKSVTIKSVKHHLIDILEPDEEYNLAIFYKDALKIIGQIHKNKMAPILVGGTGLYMDSVIHGYNIKENTHEESLRTYLSKRDVQDLQKILNNISPESLSKMNKSDLMNSRRLIRRIEKVINNSSHATSRRKQFTTLYLGMKICPIELKKRISSRISNMFKQGLVQENQKLRQSGYSTKLNALQTIGYKEFDRYFEGEQTLEETMQLIITHTQQYAKRQMTWFKRNKEIKWVSDYPQAKKAVSEFLSI